ncbi:MAG TPA: Holliday junction branch migration protein RuvA, partial [Planctomycetota bacterium]|nr:Holliday junction branch migration protein RuvA [Planctomycetota bacterium]
MYEFLRGTPASRTPNRLVLEVAGVGYELVVPAGAAFPDAAPLVVWTHLAVREDAHTLYGFPDRATRDLFRLLLRVKQVGPGVAIAILSGLSRADLLAAIRDEDAARLMQVKGVGRKTAEQVLLDLRDRIGDHLVELAPAAAPRAG